MVTGNVQGDHFDSQHLQEIFILQLSSQALGPSFLPYSGSWRLSTWGVKRPGHGAEHLPPSDAEVKNSWSCTSSPTYICIVRGQFCLITRANTCKMHARFGEVCRKKINIQNNFLPKMVPVDRVAQSV